MGIISVDVRQECLLEELGPQTIKVMKTLKNSLDPELVPFFDTEQLRNPLKCHADQVASTP